MGFIDNIRTVARFELRTLLRSWFFRIFSVLTLLILLGMNIATLTESGDNNWAIRSIISNIPYMNMAFLNIAQALLAIFLASDFLKRDKKLDTTEVIYTRSMTNWEYVWGKTLGVVLVFGILNFLVFLMALIINIVISGVDVDYLAYLLYPFLLGFPTLIFTLGLAFLLMSLIRNQAVTLVVLLGLAALSLFFIQDKVNHLFDYMAFTFPFMWSDLIGSGNLQEILLHRGIYLFLGLAFIFATILLLQRLPQSRPLSILSFVLMLGLLVLGLGGGFTYWTSFNNDKEFRQEVKELNDMVSKLPVVQIETYDLKLEHLDGSISVVASLVSEKDASELPETLVFSLNPGLIIAQCSINGDAVDFQREKHIVRVQKPSGVTGKVKIDFSYQGVIDERICYLDISDENLTTKHGPSFIVASPKRHGIIQKDYVLLTPESVWYPVSGGTFGSNLSVMPVKQFSSYNLEVTTQGGMIPISQGKSSHDGDNWSFDSQTPFHGISLVIGNYESKSLELDSLLLEIHYYKGHDSFFEILGLLADTLPMLVNETLEDYQRSLGLSYPYDFMKLVEAPVQFYSYDRMWAKGYDYVQPGMILYPENLSFLKRGNIRKELDRAIDRALDRDDMSTDEDLQAQIFMNLIKNNFIQGVTNYRMIMRGGSYSSSESDAPPWSIFPNYFVYANNFVSDEFQMINATLESYIGSKINVTRGFGRSMGGMSGEEKANLSLVENSFAELLNIPDEKNILQSVIESKGKQLFNYLEASIGTDEFISFITSELEGSRYTDVLFDDFAQRILDSYSIDISSFMENWYQGTDLPSFLVTDVRNYEIQEGENTVFQIFFTISNTGNVDGMVNVSFRTGGRGGRMGGMGMGGVRSAQITTYSLAGRDDATNHLYLVPAQTAYEYALILDDQPRMMSVNTLISSNLPANLTYPFPDIEKNRMEGSELAKQTELVTTLAQPNELIVDNEDRGFSVHEEGTSNKLSGILGIDQKKSDFKYQGLNVWRPPLTWSLTTQTGFYGDYIRSAHYTRSGEGERYVEWEMDITEAGYYDVYCYLNSMVARMSRFRGRGGDRGSGRGGESDIKDVYHYTVFHDDGEDEVSKALSNIEDGWNMLGSFYLSPGKAKIRLTNENTGRLVVADAVKWEKQ
ncbi:MAG: hypothetical protein KAH17_00070 [Bacteroidales bacterium]|nr:hypothetical protein [Bacteroidales bacterium]